MEHLHIRPEVPPELSIYPDEHSICALENSSCVKLLRKNGISKGTLLNWAPKEFPRETRKQKTSIYFPSDGSSTNPIIIKFLKDMRDTDAIVHQSFVQLQDLDRFLATAIMGRDILRCCFLFVVDRKNRKHQLSLEKKIDTVKRFLLSNCQSIGLSKLQIWTEHIMKGDSTGELEKAEKEHFMVLLKSCTDEALAGDPNPFLHALLNSIPKYQYLDLIETKFNNSAFEANEGFKLNDVEKVVTVFRKFFGNYECEISILPDFDTTPGSVLQKTKETGFLDAQHTDDFIGEEVDFTEKLLARLQEPKGLLIRRFTAQQLNSILKNAYTLNFEIDWILCSVSKMYVIEVSRSNNLEMPKSAVERKLETVFSKTVPKITLILASLLYNVEPNLSLEQRFQIVNETVEFLIYFTNVSTGEVNKCLKNCERDMKKAWNVLEVLSVDVIQKVTVLCQDDVTDKRLPTLYKIVKQGSSWGLVKSDFTVQQMFNGSTPDISTNMSKSKFSAVSPSLLKQLLLYLSGLLSFGFLIQDFGIKEPQTGSLDWHKKLNLSESVCQNIILSPQQMHILEANRRFVFLVGEPGTGKTLLLIARAFNAAKDPSIDHILFFYPDTKTEFEKNVSEILANCGCALLRKKSQIIKLSQFNETLQRLNLDGVVIFIDEMYGDSHQMFSEQDSFWIKTTNMFYWFPLIKQCWLTKTEAGQYSRDVVCRVTLPHFKTETLNVLFRCSWHIARFCTSVLHRKKAISRTTAWAYGCTVSSQHKVHCDYFNDLASLNDKIQSCHELRPKFDDNRITVIFTNAGKELDWYTRLSSSKAKLGKIFVVNDRMGFYELPFTGIERKSVLLIIDFCRWTEEEEIGNTFKLYNLAASRAQFELCIFVRDSQTQKVLQFLNKCEINVFEEVLTSARLGLPLKLGKIFDNKQPIENLLTLSNTLFQIAIERENKELALAIVKTVGAEKIDLGQVFMSLDVPKSKDFLDVLTETLGSVIKSSFTKAYYASKIPHGRKWTIMLTDLSNFGVRLGLTDTLDWIMNTIGEKISKFMVHQSGMIIFYACYNGTFEIIEWAVKIAAKYGALQKEMERLYDTWTDEKITLLLFLCRSNIDDVRPIRLFIESGFPVKLLRRKFEGRNVLENALFFNNVDMARELLRDAAWVRELIYSEDKLAKLTQMMEIDSELYNLVWTRFEETINSL